ncbi:Ribosome LSU-associated GTP-binding protein HflX [hydrothermal vent metagenome]|uniref:Ribosome LSU-associated GTP-binding protein HflX n=1 Tax=hydrothermal vent metagenome TaxID=652676 RepID=A0A3B1B463_9ZZZZ
MFERPGTLEDASGLRDPSRERAILVHVDFSHNISPQATSSRIDGEALSEFRELAISAGAEPVAMVSGTRRKPDPKYFIGTGKADEVLALIEHEQAELVLVDAPLAPSQERNLERLLKCRVLDRTGLILDIFAQRATSHEGRLQVELAQLRHLSTRLVRGWTHLERQKGGIGLRGPGETQLETDRRLLAARIKQLNKRLDKVQNQREQSRRSRRKAEVPTVSLVGYTNAGKSTLFNRLTESGVYAADQLFATLDPTLRRLVLPDTGTIILADTVGFIRNLPHDLVAAFRSTLEETRQADLLLHVIDASNENYPQQIEQVNAVLKEIGADNVPQIEVFNKVDLLTDHPARLDHNEDGQVRRAWCSAQTGDGLELLKTALDQRFSADQLHEWIRVPAANGRLRARLFDLGKVLKEQVEENGDLLLEVELARRDFEALQKTEGVRAEGNRPAS